MKSFVRRYRSEILAEWRNVARTLPVAEDMSPVTLLDHIPELLDEIADIAEEIAADDGSERRNIRTAHQHALDRLAQGFPVTLVVSELSLLRGAALAVWAREVRDGSVAELRALDLAIDRAVAISVARYTAAHERILAGIDRISMASFEASSVEELLQQLLAVFMATTPAVDTAAILLLDGDGRLRIRAAVGLDIDTEQDFSLAVGEGFAGTIAARREPMQLKSAYLDPLVKSPAIRERGIRALYGAPLIHDGQVIGVAHMGTLSASEFSADDRHFFDSLATRATMGIAHHLLRQQLSETASARERALQKLESLLRASHAGIAFLDRDLRFMRINEALADINGLPVEAHLGRTIAEVLPDAAASLEPLLRGVLETGEPIRNLEVTEPMAGDRAPRTFLVNYFPVRGPSGAILAMGGIVLDVTDDKRVREALRVEQVRTRAIIDHSPAAIWVKDPDGRVVIANQRLAEALGHDLDTVVGRRSSDLLPVDASAQHEEHDRLVLEQQRAIQVEETVPSPTGTRTFLSIKFPIPGTPPLVGGIATEISDRKRMEEELRNAVRAREDILAIVSHDLRSPLGTVKLATAMMLGQVDADHRLRPKLEMIQRAATRMESLIGDLLDIASIRTGRLHLEPRPESADTLLAEVLDVHASLAAERNVRVTGHSELAGLHVHCDRNRILQVFGNLIGNALKFSRSGEGICVSGVRTGDLVQFSVADNGPGVAPDVAACIFAPYWSASRGEGSAGLGLFIARGIVEGHGGTIWLDSAPGRGATFSFTLPIVTP